MNIYPRHSQTAARKHWVVRWLRYTGYLEIIVIVSVGMFYSYNFFAPMLSNMLRLEIIICQCIAVVLGILISFVIGLGITLPTWALAMVIDDLHALRMYNQGYVVTGEKNG